MTVNVSGPAPAQLEPVLDALDALRRVLALYDSDLSKSARVSISDCLDVLEEIHCDDRKRL